jgi:hypothetical protein
VAFPKWERLSAGISALALYALSETPVSRDEISGWPETPLLCPNRCNAPWNSLEACWAAVRPPAWVTRVEVVDDWAEDGTERARRTSAASAVTMMVVGLRALR